MVANNNLGEFFTGLEDDAQALHLVADPPETLEELRIRRVDAQIRLAGASNPDELATAQAEYRDIERQMITQEIFGEFFEANMNEILSGEV